VLPQVTVYYAEGCHLCDRAREIAERLRGEYGFPYAEVDITGDPDLEREYREWLPVVEVDGERLSVYHLYEAALRRRLSVTS
jgi:glutaredoxin